MTYTPHATAFATETSEPVQAKVWRRGTRIASPELERDVGRVKKLAGWMDAKFSILGYRVGFDGIIGLVPVVGDTVTSLIALYPLHIARKHGLPMEVQAKMAGNIAIDWLTGLVPFVGDFVDVAFKANLRNAELLEKAAAAATTAEAE